MFAIPFPSAFPPTVKDATTALSINCISKDNPNCSVIFAAIRALIAPLNTPQISPTTSAHMFATLGAFLINLIESFEPFTFFWLLLREILLHLLLLLQPPLYQKRYLFLLLMLRLV